MLGVVVMLTLGTLAIAGNVFDRSTQAIGASTGTATWTNTQLYAALELKRLWIQNGTDATNVITIKRVTSDGVYTDAVATVTCVAGTGTVASFTASYLKYGDKLAFSSLVTTGSTAVIEYEVQKH